LGDAKGIGPRLGDRPDRFVVSAKSIDRPEGQAKEWNSLAASGQRRRSRTVHAGNPGKSEIGGIPGIKRKVD